MSQAREALGKQLKGKGPEELIEPRELENPETEALLDDESTYRATKEEIRAMFVKQANQVYKQLERALRKIRIQDQIKDALRK